MSRNEPTLFDVPDSGKKALWEEYGVNPFSVLDGRDGRWQRRRKEWERIGVVDGDTRGLARSKLKEYNKWSNGFIYGQAQAEGYNGISKFDPVLCEQVYKWYCPPRGKVIDPFSGGCVRGIVASEMGLEYVGIDIREEQVSSNVNIAERIISGNPMPQWITGDCNVVLDGLRQGEYDLLFTCPPYWNKEVYSHTDGDLSNMSWIDFVDAYRNIIRKSCHLLKDGSLAVFVVGEVRGYDHYFRGLVPVTVRAFLDCGMGYYDEAIYIQPTLSAALRARASMKYGKLAKAHQNILIFQKKDSGKRAYTRKMAEI